MQGRNDVLEKHFIGRIDTLSSIDDESLQAQLVSMRADIDKLADKPVEVPPTLVTVTPRIRDRGHSISSKSSDVVEPPLPPVAKITHAGIECTTDASPTSPISQSSVVVGVLTYNLTILLADLVIF
uniref:Uncharacterized protein n=1 Tax=Solanum tuberosum TaxID=4113 RepID=M1CD28_SOLTU